jgi:hypothetical protein
MVKICLLLSLVLTYFGNITGRVGPFLLNNDTAICIPYNSASHDLHLWFLRYLHKDPKYQPTSGKIWDVNAWRHNYVQKLDGPDWWDLPAKPLLDKDVDSGKRDTISKRIIFMRDPLDRLISGFLTKIACNACGKTKTKASTQELVKIADTNGDYTNYDCLDWEKFLMLMINAQRKVKNPYFMAQASYCKNWKIRYNTIIMISEPFWKYHMTNAVNTTQNMTFKEIWGNSAFHIDDDDQYDMQCFSGGAYDELFANKAALKEDERVKAILKTDAYMMWQYRRSMEISDAELNGHWSEENEIYGNKKEIKVHHKSGNDYNDEKGIKNDEETRKRRHGYGHVREHGLTPPKLKEAAKGFYTGKSKTSKKNEPSKSSPGRHYPSVV